MDGGAAAAKPQKFSVVKRKSSAFKSDDGLRPFFEYRDLGIGRATGGRFHAHHIRAKEACTAGTGRHKHILDFQMVYVLNGWVTFDYGPEGIHRLEAGDCVLQPPEIPHELVECSDDCEILEITSPEDFGTVGL